MYGHSPPSGRFLHPSIPAHTCLSLSEGVCEGMRSPHGSWPVPPTRLVDTPTGHVSVSASSTPDPRRRRRSIAADSNRAPLGSGTLGSGLPAPAVGPRPQRPARNAFRPVLRSYPAAFVISSARSVGHRVGGILDLRPDHGVELGLEHGVVELHDFPGHGLTSLSDRGFPVRRLKIVHGTVHVLFREARITKRTGFRSLSACRDQTAEIIL